MLRLTEIRLPLNHTEGALKLAILEQLGIPGEELLGVKIARSGIDARKPKSIVAVYTLDVEINNEALEELGTAFRYNDAVLRNLIIKRKAAVTEESVIMKQERENRERKARNEEYAQKNAARAEAENKRAAETAARETAAAADKPEAVAEGQAPVASDKE